MVKSKVEKLLVFILVFILFTFVTIGNVSLRCIFGETQIPHKVIQLEESMTVGSHKKDRQILKVFLEFHQQSLALSH